MFLFVSSTFHTCCRPIIMYTTAFFSLCRIITVSSVYLPTGRWRDRRKASRVRMRREKGGASANRCKLKSVSPPQLWYCDTRVG